MMTVKSIHRSLSGIDFFCTDINPTDFEFLRWILLLLLLHFGRLAAAMTTIDMKNFSFKIALIIAVRGSNEWAKIFECNSMQPTTVIKTKQSNFWPGGWDFFAFLLRHHQNFIKSENANYTVKFYRLSVHLRIDCDDWLYTVQCTLHHLRMHAQHPQLDSFRSSNLFKLTLRCTWSVWKFPIE